MRHRFAHRLIVMLSGLILAGSFAARAQQPAQSPPPDGLPEGPGKSELLKVCGECHEARLETWRLDDIEAERREVMWEAWNLAASGGLR